MSLRSLFTRTHGTVLKSTSVKKGCANSKKTPKFGAAAIFCNYKKILNIEQQLIIKIINAKMIINQLNI